MSLSIIIYLINLKKNYSKENNTLKLTISGKYLSEAELQGIINKQNEYGLKISRFRFHN